jgi:hypothetical protein
MCAQSGRRQLAVGATHLFLLGRPQGVLSFFFLLFLLLVQHVSFYWAVRKVCLFFFPSSFFAFGATRLFLLGRPQGVLLSVLALLVQKYKY